VPVWPYANTVQQKPARTWRAEHKRSSRVGHAALKTETLLTPEGRTSSTIGVTVDLKISSCEANLPYTYRAPPSRLGLISSRHPMIKNIPPTLS
jgi:hypothetical protein